MKCQECENPATFHITELTDGKYQELHLCEDHARQYLTQTQETSSGSTSMAGALAQQLAVGQTAEELARLDKKSCPVCGISFLEFRNSGRLGCPHDYVFFREELEPLILNIHGKTQHTGKVPQSGVEATEQLTELIRARREMKEAVNEENYELASTLRDRIREIERSAKKEKTSGQQEKRPAQDDT